jgi:hypothetical protein
MLIHGRKMSFQNGAIRVSNLRKILLFLGSALLVVMLGNAARAAQSVTLAWNRNPEPDIATYVLYYGSSSGKYIYSTNAGNTTNITVTGLQPGLTYFFVVTARNTSGLESDPSTEISYGVPPSGYSPSLRVASLSAYAEGLNSVTLSWSPNSTTGVAGYRVYYGTTHGQYTNAIDVGKATMQTVSGLTPGLTYFLAVTAYTTNGLMADYFNEVSCMPGLPIVRLRLTQGRQAYLELIGQAGRTYDILAARTPTNWTVIGTATVGSSGSFQFIDTSGTNYLTRFYRARESR